MPPTVAAIHQLVAKNVHILRLAYKAASRYAKGKIPSIAAAETVLQPSYAQVSRQPVHPAAFLKQSRRWISSQSRIPDAIRRFTTATLEASSKGSAPSYASSRIGLAISRSTGRAPFASTLRPNLTGGAFPRSAGGYGLGSGRVGGKRYFSHTPEAPAQVVHNVGQAMRAFMLGGQKIHYDGVDPLTGEKRFKSISALQEKASRQMKNVPRATPGSYINFNVNPTITAIAPMTLSSVAGYKQSPNGAPESLHTEGLLDILNVDFSRALHELTLIMADLRSLSSLGDLPISYEHNRLRVHFPGVDPETVESLAAELGIKRGVVGEDADFDAFVGTEIALLFPFAPSYTSSTPSLHGRNLLNQQLPPPPVEMDSFSSPTTLSDTGLAFDDLDILSNPSDEYETIPSRSYAFDSSPRSVSRARVQPNQMPFEYQDFEGIYRFIELCDDARR
jgi:hypothetical protein